MDASLKKHLFYQRLLGSICTLDDAVRTFEKVAEDQGFADLDELRHEARRMTSPMDGSDWELWYHSLLFRRVLDLDEAVVTDLINLAHKEALARRLSILLHSDEMNLQEVVRVLADFAQLPVGVSQVSPHIAIGIRVQLISFFISDNLFYLGVAKNHITMRDIAGLLSRFIGIYGRRSRVGGKSAGMILANAILRPAFGEASGFEDRVAEVDSYFLTAEAFHRFIEENRLEEGHGLKYLDGEERERLGRRLEERFLAGRFPADVAGRIRELLETVGEVPLIARSSSLLEDSMGFPFYGKYESIFVANQGDLEERFAELTTAIKQVYVSILANSVIEYRKDKALLDYDDMMSVLIQPVVGRRYGKYVFPDAAGVAFSRNLYRWSRRIRPTDGVARLVYGLGTRAVDRSGDDYPRLVALGEPGLHPEANLKEEVRYSQRYVDVLNLETRRLESVHFADLYSYIRTEVDPHFRPAHAVSIVADGRLQTPLLYPEHLAPGSAAVRCEGLLRHGDFPRVLRGILQLLEARYGVPVDVEFACVDGRISILQCRPLSGSDTAGHSVRIPTPAADQQVLFRTDRDIFRSAAIEDLRYIVYVDPEAYRSLSEPAVKLEVARLVGRVNRALKGSRFALLGPGRWGSTNPELGVKVGYGDINNTSLLVEVAFTRGGYTPEVSYGTHFFQDLIEANIIPVALYPGEAQISGGCAEKEAGPGAPAGAREGTAESDEEALRADSYLDLGFLCSAPNRLTDLVGETAAEGSAVKVVDLDQAGPGRLSVYLDAEGPRGLGILG